LDSSDKLDVHVASLIRFVRRYVTTLLATFVTYPLLQDLGPFDGVHAFYIAAVA
jgi:hypothetical protein